MSGNTPFHDGEKLAAMNAVKIDEKKLRQKAFFDAITEQFEIGVFEGILPTLRKLSIPIGTYSGWLSDKDFQPYKDLINLTKRFRLNDEYWRAILNKGEGISYLAYLLSGLKATDPEWRERVEHSGNVGPIQLLTSVERPKDEHKTKDVVKQAEETRPKAQ